MRYFAYGSNLHAADLARFCRASGHDPSGIRALGPAWLPDHEPFYAYSSEARGGGALSVRARRGSATPGALFELDEAGERALEAKEGVRYVATERVVLLGAEEVRARTYVVRDEHLRAEHVAPTAEYAALVDAGLRAHDLPTA